MIKYLLKKLLKYANGRGFFYYNEPLPFQAHVVCVVYDLTLGHSLDRVMTSRLVLVLLVLFALTLLQVANYWLPLIKQCSVGSHKPVILAGNKVHPVFVTSHCS